MNDPEGTFQFHDTVLWESFVENKDFSNIEDKKTVFFFFFLKNAYESFTYSPLLSTCMNHLDCFN